MKSLSSWAMARAERLIHMTGYEEIFTVRGMARVLDKARDLGKEDAIRLLNKAAQEFEKKGEEGVAFACRSVGKYLRAVA